MLAKILVIVATYLCLAATCFSADSVTGKPPAFSTLAATKMQGFGVNYFNAFSRSINRPGDRSYRQGLQILASYEIPFVRVMVGGYWPSEMQLYRSNPALYFQILDDFVRTAEESRIGIVANLGWNFPTIPDLVGESVSAWGKKDSKTNAFFRKYVADVVTRYRNSPAIWMWEFSNEMALYVDLPNASEWRSPIDPTKGTPKIRTQQDDLTAKDMLVAMAEFRDVVRALDSKKPISSGNALPRPYAFHNSLNGSWKPDTKSQFCEMLARDNPEGFDVVSIHIYPHNKGYFGAVDRDYDAVLSTVQSCAKNLGKTVFIGEYGVGEKDAYGDPNGVSGTFSKLQASLLRNEIHFAALWVFDFTFQEGSLNVTPNNSRAYQLEAIRKINQMLRAPI